MTTIQQIQTLLGVTPDGVFGPLSLRALNATSPSILGSIQGMLKVPVTQVWDTSSQTALTQLQQLPVWPYSVVVDGDDLVVPCPVMITSFGGNGNGTINDRQDNGNTASGLNTKNSVVYGVALAMDSRQFPGMEVHDPAGYKALLGAPFPRLAWHTPVEVEINGTTYMADDGVVDLGPGIHASKPGLPHGCDFTLPLAQKVMPDKSLKWLADNFEVWGRVRVLGAASRYVQ